MRLVTRGDVDGLMCAVLLKKAGVIDSIAQVHPKDMQDGNFEITSNDVICNLPFVKGCGMWFDHHLSEETPARLPEVFEGRYGIAPSAARLVYDAYLPENPALEEFAGLLEVVDRFDSATLTKEDVTNPEPAMLLAFVLDPRSGLGYHHDYRISNKELTQKMPDLLLEHSVDEILAMPDVKQRTDRYAAMQTESKKLYSEHSEVRGKVVITDLRGVSEIPPANRFLIYTLPGHENTTVSIRLSGVRGGEKVSLQVGHNIFNRTSKLNVGALMADFGGGGHLGAGTCQVLSDDAGKVLADIVKAVEMADG